MRVAFNGLFNVLIHIRSLLLLLLLLRAFTDAAYFMRCHGKSRHSLGGGDDASRAIASQDIARTRERPVTTTAHTHTHTHTGPIYTSNNTGICVLFPRRAVKFRTRRIVSGVRRFARGQAKGEDAMCACVCGF